ncbi:DUF2378 family protein [Archangium lipolyticum]|uniref:DUF2378 family protein n=1 Tax=Archangium lipolyticum TaxID=2970465 RepID=UPI00214A3B43|nr:DUF2378 family protein [Archangium lipolyticum]
MMIEQYETSLFAKDLNTKAHVERNLGLASPRDTARGMFFNGALEVVRKLGGEAVAQRCRKATGESKHLDFFNYPVATFLMLCLTAAKEVGSQLGGCEQTLRLIGEQSAKDFLSSTAGKTLLLLAGQDVKRILKQVPSAYSTAVSYGTRTMTCTPYEKSGHFVIHHDFLPQAYHEGILRGVLLTAGVDHLRIKGYTTGPLDSEYEFFWK